MSAIGLIMDGLLIVLVLTAIGFGLRLEKKLKALREGQTAFGLAVSELNDAASKAHAALAELRAAGEETDLLHERIVAARQLKADLEQLVARGRTAPPRQEAPRVEPTLDALAAKVAAAQPTASQPAIVQSGAIPARLLQALAERRAAPEPVFENLARAAATPERFPERRTVRPAAVAEPIRTPTQSARRATPEDDLFEPERLRA